ncbi:glycosyltransferase family 2 protein [Photorhabdus hainanensis]|uniref:glycosyltransferase family 2 protein n=1 Tax=Photorhabdus hainanensis TaxID=1004166 RepID=UPI001BD33DDD|nr:glycosyltransferase family 2 protein [Photorhabdus hainanensis]MBS9432258.1 glycosyltransferase [Photorhabdus hainanensis]
MINVICAVYNQKNNIERTIISFEKQKYQDKKLIIIDGGSTDGTVEVLKKYQNIIDYWVSEPDHGISDAFNKGLEQCENGYVYFLGAGDTFLNENVINIMLEGCNYKTNLLVCGRIRRINPNESNEHILFTTPKTNKFNKHSLLFKMSLPHQGLFTSTIFFEKYGNFSLSCKYAMDYEHLLRAYHAFPSVLMKDITVATWITGGIGTNKTKEVLQEYHKIKLTNKIAPRWILSLINNYTLMKYMIKRLLKRA